MALVKNLMKAMEQGCDDETYSLLQYRFLGNYPIDIKALGNFFHIQLRKKHHRQSTKKAIGRYFINYHIIV